MCSLQLPRERGERLGLPRDLSLGWVLFNQIQQGTLKHAPAITALGSLVRNRSAHAAPLARVASETALKLMLLASILR